MEGKKEERGFEFRFSCKLRMLASLGKEVAKAVCQ